MNVAYADRKWKAIRRRQDTLHIELLRNDFACDRVQSLLRIASYGSSPKLHLQSLLLLLQLLNNIMLLIKQLLLLLRILVQLQSQFLQSVRRCEHEQLCATGAGQERLHLYF